MVADHLKKGEFNMAKFIGSKCKLMRREGTDLYLKSGSRSLETKCNLEKKPGQSADARRVKSSDYSMQLREKQKVKRIYGILEKQFRNYYKKAQKKAGPTGENLVSMLESRLDNTIYRLGFAPTRRSARQLVVHKHFLVNNKVVNIPSFSLKTDDVITVRDKSKKMEVFHNSMRRIKDDNPTEWLSINKAKLSGLFLSVPERSQVEEPFDEQLVIELYSK